jgi:hypothetical protein
MKLYEIPNKSKIYEEVSDGSSYFIYDHPDGMYSYCVSEKGGVCHLGLSQELEVFEDGYKFKKKLTNYEPNKQ